MIYWRIENNIGYIKLESSNKNALGVEDLSMLITLLDNDVPLCRGVIITGSGYSFCSGLDLSNDLVILIQLLDKVLYLLHNLPIPVVCVLNGHAIGAGFLIMCCADYIVSVKNDRAKFGLPEVSLGISITQIMNVVLTNKLHNSFISNLLLSSKLINFEEFRELGVINNIYETYELMMADISSYLNRDEVSLRAYKDNKQLLRQQLIIKMTNL